MPGSIKKSLAGLLSLALLLWSSGALAWGWHGSNTGPAPARCDNAHFYQDRAAFAQGRPSKDTLEDICGTVTQVYGRRHTRSGWHGYFLLQLDDNSKIRIVSDLDRMNAPTWPWVSERDKVTVRGRYYYDDARQQGIDWTHHGTGRQWSTPGYVIVNGRKYE